MAPINNLELRHALQVAIVGDEGQVVGQGCGGNLAICQGDAEPLASMVARMTPARSADSASKARMLTPFKKASTAAVSLGACRRAAP